MVLGDSVVHGLEVAAVLHLWVRLALCEQLHQAEATVTRSQHQGSAVCQNKSYSHTQYGEINSLRQYIGEQVRR